MVNRPDLKDEPYCGNCGYVLTGLTDSSKCPECGKPLVEVLTRRAHLSYRGRRWRSRARLFGMPVVDIAFGPHGTEMRGKARGIIAIGDVATGGVAIGGMACGVVAIGGMAVGLFSLGGGAVGLISASGGGAVGGMATGGGAAGVLANGGGAAGIIAQGGGAAGLYTRDARGLSSPQAGAYFDQFSWFFGDWPPTPGSTFHMMVLPLLVILVAAALIAAPALFRAIRDDWAREEESRHRTPDDGAWPSRLRRRL